MSIHQPMAAYVVQCHIIVGRQSDCTIHTTQSSARRWTQQKHLEVMLTISQYPSHTPTLIINAIDLVFLFLFRLLLQFWSVINFSLFKQLIMEQVREFGLALNQRHCFTNLGDMALFAVLRLFKLKWQKNWSPKLKIHKKISCTPSSMQVQLHVHNYN